MDEELRAMREISHGAEVIASRDLGVVATLQFLQASSCANESRESPVFVTHAN
jgi:hypothetical protein